MLQIVGEGIDTGREGRFARTSRVLLCCLLLLSLLGGSGVVAAESEQRGGVHCPPENPEQGSPHASDTAENMSMEGRMTALAASDCL